MVWVYEHEAAFNVARARVFDYYEAPGTVVRLTPEWSASVLTEPTLGLATGSRTTLRLGPPWVPSIGSHRLGLTWVAEHTYYEPNVGFTDVMRSGPMQSWEHIHQFQHRDEHTSVVYDRVNYALPGMSTMSGWHPFGVDIASRGEAYVNQMLEKVFAYRTAQTAHDLEFRAQLNALFGDAQPKTFVISGATGMIGTALSALLRSAGHTVVALVRHNIATDIPGQRNVHWDPAQHILDPQALVGADAVINLAGASIAGSFSAAHRAAIHTSRIDATTTLVQAMGKVADHGGPKVLVSASASGFYGHDVGEVVETDEAGTDFLAAVCRDWEDAAHQAEQYGIRVATIRTGLVMSARGGILGAQLPLYFAGLGGPLAGGKMWQPWISLEDIVRIYAFAAANTAIAGPVNAAAPVPVQQAEFAQTLGKVLHRPAVFPTPKIAPQMLLGRQGMQLLALSSAQLVPQVLQDAGFQFRFTHLEDALRHVLGS